MPWLVSKVRRMAWLKMGDCGKIKGKLRKEECQLSALEPQIQIELLFNIRRMEVDFRVRTL